MSESRVLSRDHGHVRLLVLNDPDRRNPLSDALAEAERAPEVHALVGVLLVPAVGEKRARKLLLGGDLIDAATAYRTGLVNRIAAAGESVGKALSGAARPAENTLSLLALTKEPIVSYYGMGLDGRRVALRRRRRRLDSPERGPGRKHRRFLRKAQALFLILA